MISHWGNYEHVKLEVLSPDHTNVIIILLFVLLASLTAKKYPIVAKGNGFLSMFHTDQLRGIAIFFVFLGHLWIHVSNTKASAIFSGDAVALFLLLSGFGLAISNRKKKVSFGAFCLKRIKRVMVPYWTVTLLILMLDYLLLQRKLELDGFLLTILGVNTRKELTNIDYVRWFITFILLWYLLFYLFYNKYRSRYSSLVLMLIAFFALPADYYVFHFGWYQYFAFPVGCLLAVNQARFVEIYKRYWLLFVAFSIGGVVYVVFWKILMTNKIFKLQLGSVVPSILLEYYFEWNSLVLSFSILILIGFFVERGVNSNILLLLGKYSYEIFLLHGVFLIKYDPIITGHTPFAVSCQFLLLFIAVTALSVLVYKGHHLLSCLVSPK